jgi:hypothetical protein
MNATLKRSLLRVLLACDGVPMPETALISAAKILSRPPGLTDGDVRQALGQVEAAGFVAGVTDELTAERSWTLTLKGTLRARQL